MGFPQFDPDVDRRTRNLVRGLKFRRKPNDPEESIFTLMGLPHMNPDYYRSQRAVEEGVRGGIQSVIHRSRFRLCHQRSRSDKTMEKGWSQERRGAAYVKRTQRNEIRLWIKGFVIRDANLIRENSTNAQSVHRGSGAGIICSDIGPDPRL